MKITVTDHGERLAIGCDRCSTLRTVTRDEAERMSVDPDAAAAFLTRHAQTCAGRKNR